MMSSSRFAVFIITHGRPDNIYTLKTLKKHGYTGDFYLVVDDEDEKSIFYKQIYPNKVKVFNKKHYADLIDEGDNFDDRRTTTHARNYCFDLAKELLLDNFLVLDDDYTSFNYKLIIEGKPVSQKIFDLNAVFASCVKYHNSIQAKSICFAQEGDFIGGIDNGHGAYRFSKRKAMNSFFCKTEDPFMFFSRMNEDVNTYLLLGNRGELFLTIPFLCLSQQATQKTKGGMTETYLDNGTYNKSFFTSMYCPSFTKVTLLKTSRARIHYSVKWEHAVPQIIDEKWRKI